MNEYSYNQIKRMEQEATKRALEARQKAKPEPEKSENKQKLKEIPQDKKRGSFSFLNALDLKKLIGENSEQAMILLLILILANDNTCDEYLLYALIYIML